MNLKSILDRIFFFSISFLPFSLAVSAGFTFILEGKMRLIGVTVWHVIFGSIGIEIKFYVRSTLVELTECFNFDCVNRFGWFVVLLVFLFVAVAVETQYMAGRLINVYHMHDIHLTSKTINVYINPLGA